MTEKWIHELDLPFKCVTENSEFTEKDLKEAVQTARFFLDKIEELNLTKKFNYKGSIPIQTLLLNESK